MSSATRRKLNTWHSKVCTVHINLQQGSQWNSETFQWLTVHTSELTLASHCIMLWWMCFWTDSHGVGWGAIRTFLCRPESSANFCWQFCPRIVPVQSKCCKVKSERYQVNDHSCHNKMEEPSCSKMFPREISKLNMQLLMSKIRIRTKSYVVVWTYSTKELLDEQPNYDLNVGLWKQPELRGY